AEAKHTSVFFASDTFSICPGQKGMIIMKGSAVYLDEVVPDLKGNYQRPNIIGVVQAIEQLRLRGFRITDDNIRNGLQHVVDLTGLKGRWQKLRDRPATYCDTAHNPEGISYLVRQIRSQTYTNLHMVLGMTKGKDIDKMLVLLPADAMYYFCEAKLPRAVEAEVLAAKARVFGLRGVVIHDVNEAMHQALNEAAERDFVFIGGSTFVVAEIEDL
ncbi:MAG TPA: bifunctional folylpolyglutamate synthase/dihydrofolate synthase, partial [Cyclobacteriaceae bacterium]